MLKKYLFIISIATILLSTFTIVNAQEKKKVKAEIQVNQHNDMQKYMEIIASDSSMRNEMINLMIAKCKGNESNMMEMGKSMMQNPEMNSTLAKLMSDDEFINNNSIEDKNKVNDKISKEKMIMEPTKTVKKPKYNSN